MSYNILKFARKHHKGFSLVELIMVVAIFIIIAAIILSKQSKFSSDILVTNAAYDIALSIREAQVYGVGAKQYGSESHYYGINLDGSQHANNEYVFFIDSDESGDFSTDDEFVDIRKTLQGQKIKDYCTKSVSLSGWQCYSDDSSFYMNLLFLKPNPDPYIVASPDYGPYSEAIIVVESALGDKCRVVRINKVGQIAVDPFKVGEDACLQYKS